MIFNLKVWKQPACDEYRYQVTETLSQVSVMSLSPFMNWVSLKLTNFNSDESESSIGQICSVSLSPTGSPWRGGDVVVYVFDINLLSLPTPFFLFCSCVCFCFYSPFGCTSFKKFCDNSPLSHCSCGLFFCLLVLSSIYISLYESLLQPWCNPLWLTGLKAPTN